MSVAFSPCGSTIASGSADGSIRLWDAGTGVRISNASTGALKTTLLGRASVWNIAFSPCGSTIASGYWDGSIKLWDVKTGALTYTTLQGHTNTVRSVAFSPCGSTIASGGLDGSIKLWDVDTSALTTTLQGHSITVSSVAFSSCGSTLASCCGIDNDIKLWDTGTGKLKATLQGHTKGVMSVAFSPCGSTIASGSADGSIRLWDAGTGALKKTLRVSDDTAWVLSVAFCPVVDRSHAVSCVRRLSRHLLPDVADVVVSFMFGRVHSGLAREAMLVESESDHGEEAAAQVDTGEDASTFLADNQVLKRRRTAAVNQ
jgi:WD40 repeat protein